MKKRNYIYDFILGFAAIFVIVLTGVGMYLGGDKNEINNEEKLAVGDIPTNIHFTGLSFNVGNTYFDEDTQFPKIETYDGDYIGNASYCFDLTKNTPLSTMLYSNRVKAGYDVSYVIQNGYKGKTATNLSDELSYYGTQLVIHKFSGNSLTDVSQHIDSLDDATKADLLDYMNDLISNANTYKSYVQAGLTITSSPDRYELKKVSGENYYQTDAIYVNSNTSGVTINIALQEAPSGATIVNSSGNTVSSITAGQYNKIRVPSASLSNTQTTFTVNYSASRTVYASYIYYPTDDSYQPVVLGELFPETQTGSGKISVSGVLEQETPKYSLTITKQDGNGSNVSGATLRLEKADGSLVEEWSTSTSNPKTISNLEAGTYILKETVVPTGYTGFTNQTIIVNETSEKNIVVNNTPVPPTEVGSVSILKTDGTNPLAGAVLRLETTGGTLIEQWTSDTNPHVINDLQVGTYVLREVSAPSGYRVAETVNVQVTLNNVTSVSFVNSRTSVTINKTNGSGPLAGARLQVLNSQNQVVDEWTTDATGKHTITGLPVGTYTVKEVEAPEGYVIPENGTRFTISPSADTPDVTIVNSQTRVIISKLDSTNNNHVAGATLEVRDSNGNQLASWVTDGSAHELLTLGYGTYTLRETAAPDGYALNAEEISFTLDASNQSVSLILQNDPVIEVPKTALNVSKTIINFGLFLILIGGGLVYYYVKHPKNEQ